MDDTRIIEAQLKRTLRAPWQVVARCSWGYPQTIVSPLILDDGTPFPTWAYLCCPVLIEACGVCESTGELAQWDARIAADDALQQEMWALNKRFLGARNLTTKLFSSCSDIAVASDTTTVDALATDSADSDVLIADAAGARDAAATGLVGQRYPLRAKCLHAHVAYELAGLNDPLGKDILARYVPLCASSAFCSSL